MKTSEALKITGSLSKPSKMPGWAYGLPAKECKTGEPKNAKQAASFRRFPDQYAMTVMQ